MAKLLDTERNGGLTLTLETTWPRGPRRARLVNPAPDMAFGIGFEETGPLSMAVLDGLYAEPGINLLYSPLLEKEYIVFPAVVYEVKSDRLTIENHMAVGVAKALDLLAELSKLSRVPFQHSIVALVSSDFLLEHVRSVPRYGQQQDGGESNLLIRTLFRYFSEPCRSKSFMIESRSCSY